MAGVTGKSSLFGKMGNRLSSVHAKIKDKEPEVDTSGRLPAGIENGIARLYEVKIGEYKEGANKGEPFFHASGVVVEPVMHEGIKVAGRHTRIGPEPLCDTPKSTGKRKTFEDHYAWMIDQLKILGLREHLANIPTNATAQKVEEHVRDGIALLNKIKPYFQFRTWKGKKATEGPYKDQEPRVQEVWQGQVEYSPTESNGAAGVVDSTGAGAAANNGEAPAPFNEVQEPETAPSEAEAGGDEGAQDVDLPDDLEALLDMAGDGNEAAADKVTEIAVKAGISAEAVRAAEKWSDVLTMIRKAGGEKKEPAAWHPLVGEVYYFKPVDPKTKKASAKPVECEVVSVGDKAKVVGLKNLMDKKTVYKAVKWEALSVEPS